MVRLGSMKVAEGRLVACQRFADIAIATSAEINSFSA